MKQQIFKKSIIGLLIALMVLLVGGFFVLKGLTYPAGDLAKEAMESNAITRVIKEDIIAFEPLKPKGNQGVVFYPGALVSAEAYAPLAQKIAKEGYPVYIVKMPLNIAVLSPLKGEKVLAAHPEISEWIVGGHSLGGAMAPKLAEKQANKIKGVYFLAAYPVDDSLKKTNLKVLSLWGSQDGVANLEKVKAGVDAYPAGAVMQEIMGGSHDGFGDYGPQKGDNAATISKEDQMTQAAQGILALMTAGTP